MLIGSITNWGEIQGQINDANGYLTGVISNAELIGGEIVGLRGLQGEQGEQGETGVGIQSVSKTSSSGLVDTYTITFTDGTTTTYTLTNGQDGADGADGYSPSASVSKVGSVATITITDKDGTTTAEVYDGGGGGASAFIAEYGVTTYADVKDAYDEDAIILCAVDDSGNTVICQLAYYDDENGAFYFSQPQSEGAYWVGVSSDDTWDDGYFQFASTDTATQLRDGLMSALDWQKLDGIASGAEVNVQSDWNEADNTADDYIKNKPTIPTVNNATLTIQKNGTTVNTFTANASSDVTANITVDDEIFIAEYGVTTLADVVSAYNSGKTLFCKRVLTNSTRYLPFTHYNDAIGDYFGFSGVSGGNLILYVLQTSGWSEPNINATSLPDSVRISRFDSDAHMNSTDMTTGVGGEVEDFVDSLNVGGNSPIFVRKDDALFALDTTSASGTVDGDLYASIVALGWQTNVIE